MISRRSIVFWDGIRDLELQARAGVELTRETLVVRKAAIIGDLLFELVSLFQGLFTRNDPDSASPTRRISTAGMVERKAVFESNVQNRFIGPPKVDFFPSPSLFTQEKED